MKVAFKSPGQLLVGLECEEKAYRVKFQHFIYDDDGETDVQDGFPFCPVQWCDGEERLK